MAENEDIATIASSVVVVPSAVAMNEEEEDGVAAETGIVTPVGHPDTAACHSGGSAVDSNNSNEDDQDDDAASIVSSCPHYSSARLAWPTAMGREEPCEIIATTILRVCRRTTTTTNALLPPTTTTTRTTTMPEILHLYGPSGTGKSTTLRVAYDLALSRWMKRSSSMEQMNQDHLYHDDVPPPTPDENNYNNAAVVQDEAGIVWVGGKYDEEQSLSLDSGGEGGSSGGRPLSAVVDALTELYRRLPRTAVRAIREQFTRDELQDLSAVIPLPATIYNEMMHDDTAVVAFGDGPGTAGTRGELSSSVQHKNDANQFRTFLRLFRRLLSLICQHYDCVVLALDDVQWCDEASRDLIDDILASDHKTNDDMSNVLFIVAQRTGPDEPDFLLPTTEFPITKVELTPLSPGQLNPLLAAALRRNPSDTEPLTQEVYRRTGGNTLFFVQFVELLCAKRLIQRTTTNNKNNDDNDNNATDKDGGSYQWDLAAIAGQTRRAGGDVAELLVKKLKSLHEEIQLALIVAAHIGFRFRGKVILELLEHSELVFFPFLSASTNGKTKNGRASSTRYLDTFNATMLYGGLEQAQKIGLIEQMEGTDEYRFVHDRVQKCARGLVPKDQTGDQMLEMLGMLLLDRIEADEAEPWMVFAAVKLLVKHGSAKTVSVPRLARLCLRAATAARTQSSYKQSARHAETGYKKLGKNGWVKEYQLMLNLCYVAAEMHFAAGNMTKSKSMVAKIEENVQCVVDRFRAYNVLGEIYSAEGDFQGCIVEYRRRLVDLGVTLPKQPGKGAVLTNLLKTKALLRGRSAKDLDDLPLMKDRAKMQAVRMLGLVGEAYFSCGDSDACASTCLVMFQVVLKYGVCAEGVYAFSAYAVCLGFLGDVKECAAFFNLGKKLAAKDDVALSITSCCTHNLGNFLSHDLANSPHELMQAFEAAMRIGDIFRAGFCLRDVCPIGIMAGYRLDELEEKIIFCVEFCKHYNQKGHFEHMRSWLQFAECIRGQTDDCTVLSGSLIEKDMIMDFIKDPTKLAANHLGVLGWHYCQNFVLLVHNRPKQIIEEIKKFRHIPEVTGTNCPKIINRFNCALAYFTLVGDGGGKKRRYTNAARSCARVVKKHAVAGSPALRTMGMVIDAEEAALSRQMDTSLSLYEQAAGEFLRQRMYLYRAITLERAARLALSVGGGGEDHHKVAGLRLLQDSYREYETYGADAKTASMRQQHPSINFTSPVPESVPEPPLLLSM